VLRSTSGRCDATPIFTRHCATSNCHSGGNPSGELDLSTHGTDAGAPAVPVESRLVGVASKSNGCEARLLIDPNDVEQSFLLEKLESTAPECGVQMPLTGDISRQERACIRSWVVGLVGDGGLAGDGSAPPPADGSGAGADASTSDSGVTP
jgi:hypothetical protein